MRDHVYPIYHYTLGGAYVEPCPAQSRKPIDVCWINNEWISEWMPRLGVTASKVETGNSTLMPLTSSFNYLNNSNEIDVINNFDLSIDTTFLKYINRNMQYTQNKRYFTK